MALKTSLFRKIPSYAKTLQMASHFLFFSKKNVLDRSTILERSTILKRSAVAINQCMHHLATRFYLANNFYQANKYYPELANLWFLFPGLTGSFRRVSQRQFAKGLPAIMLSAFAKVSTFAKVLSSSTISGSLLLSYILSSCMFFSCMLAVSSTAQSNSKNTTRTPVPKQVAQNASEGIQNTGENDLISSSLLLDDATKAMLLYHRSGRIEVITIANGARSLLGNVLGPVYAADTVLFGSEDVRNDIDARGIVVIASEKEVSLYRYPSLQYIAAAPNLQLRINTAKFDPKGESVLLGGADGVVYRWKLFDASHAFVPRDSDAIERYFGHAAAITQTYHHTKAKIFFSVDQAGTLSAFKQYDADRFSGAYDKNLFHDRSFADTAQRKTFHLASNAAITSADFNAAEEFFIAGGDDGSIELVALRGFERLAKENSTHRGDILSLAILSKGNFVSVGRDGQVVLWEIRSRSVEGRATKRVYSIEPVKKIPIIGALTVMRLTTHQVVVATRESKAIVVTFEL